MSDYKPSNREEIELFDIIRILWKWKYLVIVGTILSGIGATTYCLSLPDIFKAKMTIEPGILRVNENGERIYFYSFNDISGRIKAGVYNSKIVNEVYNNKDEERFDDSNFSVSLTKGANIFSVSYETRDLHKGISVLNNLFDQIRAEGEVLSRELIAKYNHRISILTIEIEKSNKMISSHEMNLQSLSKRISEIRVDIEEIEKNSIYLNNERKDLINRTIDAQESLSVLLFSNTIQQSIQLVNSIKKDLDEYLGLKEVENQKVIGEKDNLKKNLQILYNLKNERDGIQNMTLALKPESSDPLPVGPHRLLIVLTIIAGSFVLMMLCSLIVEYINNAKKQMF